jgi:hypothetical protein
MKVSFFRSRKPGRPKGPSFRPALECLENREVPAVTTASAAFTDLPTAVSAVQADLTSGNTSKFATDLANVNNDVSILFKNAASFTHQDRQRIDMALFSNGLRLDTIGLTGLLKDPQAGIQTVLAGAQSTFDGVVDAALALVTPAGTHTLS